MRKTFPYRFTILFLAGCFLLTAESFGAAAEAHRLSLSPAFSDNMVLPHGVNIPVAGKSGPGVEVVVRFGTKIVRTRSDEHGRWRVGIAPEKPSLVSRTLEIRTKNESLKFENVLVGEVWLCAGQSNMLFELKHCDEADKVATLFDAASSERTTIRFLKRFPRNGWQADVPFGGRWTVGSVAEANGFSGVACFFALHRTEAKPGIPIGLIGVSYGGAPIESFLDRKLLADSPLKHIVSENKNWYDNADYAPWCAQRARDEIDRLLQRRRQEQADGKTAPEHRTEPRHLFGPGGIYDASLSDWAGFPLTGVLWYQGESNATSNLRPDIPLDAEHNEQAMRLLVGQFRRDFPKAGGSSEHLPVFMVQLPGMNRPWAEYRASQWKVARELSDVVAVVTTDTGLPNDVHPRDKEPVGFRLAEAARRVVDGRKDAAVFPEAFEARFHDGRIEVRFSPPGRLVVQGDEILEIELVDAEGKIRSARGTLRQRSGETRLWVEPGDGERPVEVRYNWVNVPRGNLYSGQKLPAAPFCLMLP